ncbi:MAG: transposase [Zoogloeaceae bacterium]|jgi:hypothetical protein|nr:transposase [Zoogloeaceae bacterium]
MKAHIGVDLKSGLAHTVTCSTAKGSDNSRLKDCPREEELLLADRGCHWKNRTIEDFAAADGRHILTPAKKPAGGELTKDRKAINRELSRQGATL